MVFSFAMLELWKLKRERRKIVAAYAKEYKALAAKKDRNLDERDMIAANEYSDLNAIDIQIDLYLSDTLIEEAKELDLPLPPHSTPPMEDEYWEIDHPSGRSCLSVDGRQALRASIDGYKARRSEKYERRWKIAATIITALTGLGGVIIGIISLLHKAK
jgi:hypothetical protein